MTSLNNINSLNLNGIEVKKIDVVYDLHSKNKDKIIATQQSLEKALTTEIDCGFEFNNQHMTNMLYETISIKEPGENLKDMTYGIGVNLVSSSEFEYSNNCLENVNKEEIYFAKTLKDEHNGDTYIIKNFEEIQATEKNNTLKSMEYNYAVSDVYDSTHNAIDLAKYPYKRIYLPQNSGNDIYYIPAETFDIEDDDGNQRNIKLWDTTNDWDNFFTDMNLTKKFVLGRDYEESKVSTSEARINEIMYTVKSGIFYKPTSKDSSLDLCINLTTSYTGRSITDTGIDVKYYGKYYLYNDTRKKIYRINNIETLEEPINCSYIIHTNESSEKTARITLPAYDSSKPDAVYKLSAIDNNTDDGFLYHVCNTVDTNAYTGYYTHGYGVYNVTTTQVLNYLYTSINCDESSKLDTSIEISKDSYLSESDILRDTSNKITQTYKKFIIRELYYKPTASTTSTLLMFKENIAHTNGYITKYNAGTKTVPVYPVTLSENVNYSIFGASTMIETIPDNIKKIIMSSGVYLKFNCTRTEPLEIVFEKINIVKFPQIVTNGKMYINCTFTEFGSTSGVVPTLEVDELHITAQFFDSYNLDTVVVGTFGNWGTSETKINKLFVKKDSLYTAITDESILKTRISTLLQINSEKIQFE